MSQPEQFDVLILGSGTAGKLMAWHMAGSGRRTAVVERRWVGGSCPNIACMPSKNEIRSAEVAHLARHAAEFGAMTGPVRVDMAIVRRRKRDMVEAQVAKHLQNYKKSSAELIMGSGRFRRAENARGEPERRRDAHAGGRPGVSRPRNARSDSRAFPASRPRDR